MGNFRNTARLVIGVVCVAVALFNFIRGDDWVVWMIVGVLFVGFSVFVSRNHRAGQP